MSHMMAQAPSTGIGRPEPGGIENLIVLVETLTSNALWLFISTVLALFIVQGARKVLPLILPLEATGSSQFRWLERLLEKRLCRHLLTLTVTVAIWAVGTLRF